MSGSIAAGSAYEADLAAAAREREYERARAAKFKEQNEHSVTAEEIKAHLAAVQAEEAKLVTELSDIVGEIPKEVA